MPTSLRWTTPVEHHSNLKLLWRKKSEMEAILNIKMAYYYLPIPSFFLCFFEFFWIDFLVPMLFYLVLFVGSCLATQPPSVGSPSGFALSFTQIDPTSGEAVAFAGTEGPAQGEDFWPTSFVTNSFWFRSDGLFFGCFNIRSLNDVNYFQPLSFADFTQFQVLLFVSRFFSFLFLTPSSFFFLYIFSITHHFHLTKMSMSGTTMLSHGMETMLRGTWMENFTWKKT